jgi:PAS domain S-box-containing protein
LFAASDEVSRNEFAEFIRSQGAPPAVKAFEWIPRVAMAERSDYEQMARRDGVADYFFTERKADGTLAPAGERPEYFPVYFLEPVDGNEAALGFDLASSATRLAALQQARDSGDSVATARIPLVQDSGEQFGFLMFRPVYRKGAATGTVTERRDSLQGLALGVFLIHDLVAASMRKAPDATALVEIEILDRSAPAAQQRLYPAESPEPVSEGFRVSRELTVGGRQWLVSGTPSAAFDRSLPLHWRSWGTLLAGLTFTALASLLLYLTLNRSADIRRLVAERTVQLQDSEARSQAVIQTAVDAVVTIDAHGIIQSFNPAAETTFGYAATECIGHNVSMLMPEPDHSAHDGYLRNYLGTGSPKVIGIGREVIGRRKNGEEFPMDLAVGEFRIGNQSMFAGICRDVTARRRAQDEIAAVNKELESFAYSVSHDLRAPLRGIDGFSQALVEDFGTSLPDDAQQYLRRIRAGAQRMGQLIDDMLTLSRVTRGEINRERVDLSALAETVAAELRRLNPDRDVTFDCQPGIQAQGDSRQLRILLENLIGNAWKFTAGNGHAAIEFGVTTRGRDKVYYLRDNGAGFEMDYADKLFAPFQRLHSVDEFEGTGVGLATVARVVQRHGGRVWGEGEVGKGAVFYFTLGG